MTALSQDKQAQRMQALENANVKRTGVKDFRHEIRAAGARAGARRLAAVIRDEHDDFVLGSGRIAHLLLAVPGLGESSVTRCLIKAGVVRGDRHLRDLTARQRSSIALQLELWSVGRR
jgi:hypothetical protein